WNIIALPAVFITAIILVVVYQPDHFANAKDSLRKTANEILDSPNGKVKTDFEVAGLEISLATRGPGRSVYFYDAGGFIGNSARGWVYAPEEPPVGGNRITFDRVTDGWYEFSYYY